MGIVLYLYGSFTGFTVHVLNNFLFSFVYTYMSFIYIRFILIPTCRGGIDIQVTGMRLDPVQTAIIFFEQTSSRRKRQAMKERFQV